MKSDGLFVLPEKIQTRWANPENYSGEKGAGGSANFGRKGSACRGQIEPGETWVLAEAQGQGTVRRIWTTMSNKGPRMLRGMVVRMYWDGSEKPAVEVPFGDFFCNPLGRIHPFFSTWFNNAEGRNWNCDLPMPFRTGFKITVTNETPEPNLAFWYHVDFTLGEEHPANIGYFHAFWNRENPTTLRRDLEILPRVQGRGRYLGANLGIITSPLTKSWWGEGEVKIFLDGDTDHPTLCGTGTEDYICTAYSTGTFSLPWYGCRLLASPDPDRDLVSLYRFHGSDPVYFYEECRVTVQQIGLFDASRGPVQLALYGETGAVMTGDGEEFLSIAELAERGDNRLFERQDDWCATAYFYLDRPTNELPALVPFTERVANLLSAPEETNRKLAAIRRSVCVLPELSRVEQRLADLPKDVFCQVGLHWKNEAELLSANLDTRDDALCEELTALREGAEKAGFLSAGYSEILHEKIQSIALRKGFPIVLRDFTSSPLLPPVDDLAEIAYPGTQAGFQPVPFTIPTELADVRTIHEGNEGLIFLRTQVDWDVAGNGCLAFGSDAPVKVWVNAVELAVIPDATNPARIEEYREEVRWVEGSNEILFALQTKQGKAWGVQARAYLKDSGDGMQ